METKKGKTLEEIMKDGTALEFLPDGIGRVLLKRPHENIVSLKISEVTQYFSHRFNVRWDANSQKFRATIFRSTRNFSGPTLPAVLNKVRSFQ